VDKVKPGEERPEVKVAQAVEALSEPPAAEHVVPEAVAATKLPEIAKAASPAVASAGERAPGAPDPDGHAVDEAKATAGKAAHGVRAEGAEREPERVGKSGAQGDGDDIG
jgi:hypothetical protein